MYSTLPGKRKRAFSFFVFFAWFGLIAGNLGAQQNFNILHFSNDNFLPQNSVNRVAFDKNGYTWISTQFGLVRYDGSHFRTYNTFNTPGLKNNRFMYVANDAKGNIYALDGRSAVIQVTDTGFTERKDLRPFQNCFFLPQFVNLGEMLKTTNQPFRDYKPFKDEDNLVGLFPIDSARFYFTSENSTGYFDGRKLNTHSSAGFIKSFMNREFLFVLLNDGSYKVYEDDKQIASDLKIGGDIISNEIFKKSGIASSVFTARRDSGAYLFLNHALYEVTGNKSQVTTQLICDSLEVKDCIYIGHNAPTGAYYLCSRVEGLYVLQPKKFKSLTIPVLAGNTNSNVQYSVIEAGRNKILSANEHVYENEKVIPVSLNITSRFSFYSDKDHHLFFQGGLNLYETDSLFNVLAKYPLNGSKEVKCISKDRKGMLWIAVGNKLGVFENGTFHFYLVGSEHEEIESFVTRDDSLIWMATTGGLFLFNTLNQRFEEIKKLGGVNVRTLKFDNDKTLWIGTYGQGFYRYKDQGLVKFPVDKNGYLSTAHCFMEDRNGFFWITTNHGLFQVKKADLNDYADDKSKVVYYQYYDKSNGFTTNEFNGGCNPCGIQISDGSFILPSIEGLVKFNPEDIRPATPSGPIFVDKISADTISYSPFGSFKLNSQFHQLVFEVSNVYYGNANNNNIEYHIAGLDDDWYPLNEERKITITSLPYGDYTMQLRCLAGFGTNNYVHTNISFSVAPKFFETVWFRLLALLVLIIFIWLGFRVRYNVLRTQKAVLTKEVAERTRALQRTVQDLQLSENSLYSTIQQKEKITSILVHDLKSPLRFLTLVSDHIHSEIDNGSREELKKLTQEMKKSSRRISMFTDEFLAWLLAAKEDFTVGKEVIELNDLADEIADFFDDILAANQNKLEVNIEHDLKVTVDARLLRVILRNLIDNANKHTRKGIIKLEGMHLSNHVEIRVKDNGNGMTKEQLKSFSDLDGNRLGFSLNVSNQLGSRIIRDFIHKLGGGITAESEIGEGTCITLKFKH